MNVNVFMIFAMEKQYCDEYPLEYLYTNTAGGEIPRKWIAANAFIIFYVVSLAF